MSLIHGGSGTRGSRSLASTKISTLAKYGKTVGAGAAIAAIETGLGMRLDPAPAYLFIVELEGIIAAFFTECSGLELTRDVEEYAEGGNNNFVHKLPGRVKHSNLILRRGLSVSRALWEWFSVGMYDFEVQRINMSIIQGAPGHNLVSAVAGLAMAHTGVSADVSQPVFQALGGGFGKVKHWNVENAFPVRWKGPELNTSSANVAIEEIEIAHHGLELSSSITDVLTPMSIGASVVKAAVGTAARELSTPKQLPTSEPENEQFQQTQQGANP